MHQKDSSKTKGKLKDGHEGGESQIQKDSELDADWAMVVWLNSRVHR